MVYQTKPVIESWRGQCSCLGTSVWFLKRSRKWAGASCTPLIMRHRKGDTQLHQGAWPFYLVSKHIQGSSHTIGLFNSSSVYLSFQINSQLENENEVNLSNLIKSLICAINQDKNQQNKTRVRENVLLWLLFFFFSKNFLPSKEFIGLVIEARENCGSTGWS